MKAKTPHLAYVKLLNLLQAIREIPGFPKVDEVEEKLLWLSANALSAGAPLTVVVAMGSVPGASPSTVHRRLKELRRKGLVDFGADAADSRIKYILLTPLAERYFSQLSDCVRKAAQRA